MVGARVEMSCRHQARVYRVVVENTWEWCLKCGAHHFVSSNTSPKWIYPEATRPPDRVMKKIALEDDPRQLKIPEVK